MLVVTRRLNESIVITVPGAAQITITVTDVRSTGAVRLGVDAPRDWPVHRHEIQQRIDAKQSEQSATTGDPHEAGATGCDSTEGPKGQMCSAGGRVGTTP